MLDLLTIGDTTTDVYIDVDEGVVACERGHEDCQICFSYGSKIPVKHMSTSVLAGNAANVAVGTSRLGCMVGIYTILGGDARAKEIREQLKKEKVALNYVTSEKNTTTNYSTVINDIGGDRTIFTYHTERKYQITKLPKVPWIYFSSITGNHDEFSGELVNFVKRNKVKLCFNPGSTQLRLGIAHLEPIMSVTEILFVNRCEAVKLVGAGSIATITHKLRKFGPNLVVLTDGENGSYCLDQNGLQYLSVIDVPVVQRTGLGDAYASGFVAARIAGEPIAEAMRWGSVNSESVLGQIGSQKGLLKYSELKKYLKNHPRFQPKAL